MSLVTTGTVSMGTITVQTDSIEMDKLADVDASIPSHDDIIIYKVSATEPAYPVDGWYSGSMLIENMGNVISAASPGHNEIMTWNDTLVDGAYATGWVNKNISAVFTGLSTTISGIVSTSNAVEKGLDGNSALSDMIMMSETASLSGPTNVSIGSSEDNNAVFKKELTDTEFVFVQTMTKGEIADLTYTTGTILRSTKGIYGITGPFPTPLGISSFNFKKSRFATTVASTTVIIASTGTECEVTLFEADGSTVADGPITISENAVNTLACNSTGEFLISSTGSIVAVVNGNGTELRIVPPMSTELMCWNTGNFVSCLEGTATVTWTRRNGTTGTTSVTSGTPTALGAGNNTAFARNGCVIVRADKPICCYTGSDGTGTQSVPGWPMDNLSQKFALPSFMDGNVDYGISCIAVGAPCEGTVEIYDNTDTLVDSFNLTRSVSPATTPAEQLFPASQRWNPNEAATTLNGGYVLSNVPCVCYANFNGSSVWTSDNGSEIALAGTTPEDIRAVIRKDPNGLLRRRTLDGLGNITWPEC